MRLVGQAVRRVVKPNAGLVPGLLSDLTRIRTELLGDHALLALGIRVRELETVARSAAEHLVAITAAELERDSPAAFETFQEICDRHEEDIRFACMNEPYGDAKVRCLQAAATSIDARKCHDAPKRQSEQPADIADGDEQHGEQHHCLDLSPVHVDGVDRHLRDADVGRETEGHRSHRRSGRSQVDR